MKLQEVLDGNICEVSQENVKKSLVVCKPAFIYEVNLANCTARESN